MYWTEFLTVALIHLLAVASPGPDFAVVVRESVTHGRRAGMFTAFGVGTAIALYPDILIQPEVSRCPWRTLKS